MAGDTADSTATENDGTPIEIIHESAEDAIVSLKEETTEKAKNVGAAGTGGVGPFIYAKSLLKELDKTEHTTVNRVEREFHSILDHRCTSENFEEPTGGTKTTS